MRAGDAPRLLAASVGATATVAAAALGAGPEPAPGTALGAGFPPPPQPAPAKVWVVGDGADGSALSDSVADMIEAKDPDRFLYLGDVYDNGTAEEFDENYDPIYGRFNSIAAPTPGNHEWGNRDEGYRPYWEDATGVPMPDWYSFKVAGWQVLSLNSEAAHGPESEQVEWIRNRLRATKSLGTCRLVFFHHPRYSAGDNGDEEDVEPFWDELAHRARIVLGGHDHDMQRLRPRRGIVQFVSGAGGHALRDVDEDDPRLAFARDHVAGALRLRLGGTRARYAFVSAGGQVLDSGTLRCKRQG